MHERIQARPILGCLPNSRHFNMFKARKEQQTFISILCKQSTTEKNMKETVPNASEEC